ncbi:hypothetical protein BKD76_11470 [Corynebacterium diphtheriae]|nr:hypothetical protein BS112_01760 [Corynebacterium diphtheriae]APM35983.1 hypothetical protein BS112_05220 [Corynebacterium diphtheriae]APM36204.1 hypothetical protein BS112_06685 [Corynebacterium diphtheriae]APM36326.1 hypothetical protein BS112_07435 [Corynebacterium diphtheriae]APM37078.1 hypothetical protein BS112_11815 [Corynebacterium diphtheriae]
MMVFSRTVWCGGVVVVVFVVVVCVCSLFLCVGALLGVWDNMVVLVDHSCGFCVGVAGCVLVVLHGAMWLVCCVRTV